MSSSLSETILEKKFMGVSSTQDSIQTLSLWLLHHKAHHKKIVNAWLKVLKKDKVNHRLTLFYLANDVIQNSRRKNVSFFKDSFAEVLKDAVLHLRDEHIKNSVDRVLTIWDERNVYDSDFIEDLQAILTNAKVPATVASKVIADFQCDKVVDKIRLVRKFEMEISTKLATVNQTRLNATDAEIIQKLKDRKHGQHFSHDFEENAKCLSELAKATAKMIEERKALIELLEQSDIYYDTQRGEAKIVANAYKSFSIRVKGMQKKMEDVLASLGEESPVPSPCPDAPSPTNSETELNLPDEGKVEDDSDHEKSESSSVSSSSKPTTTSAVGNPIPTVSNLFSQEPGSMTPWLDSFTKNSNSPLTSTSTSVGNNNNNSTSLDSRLSTLLQNIPNLPSGFQSTLFGAGLADNSESATNSPASTRKGNSNPLHRSETSVKDGCSGQNTPLQDEDTPSGASFFSRLASNPKASQSPKEILKGLKDFIQNASSLASDKSHIHDNNRSWSPDKSDPAEKISKPKSKNATSHFSDTSKKKSSSVYKSPPHPTTTGTIGISSSSVESTNFSQVSFSDTLTYAPMQSSSETSISQSILQNLSFIPTLVPSTPTGSNFNYCGDEPYDIEYSPGMEDFDADMDIDSDDDDSQLVSTAEPSEKADVKIGSSLPRPSALITLVTDNGTSEKKDEAFDEFPKSDRHVFSETKRRRFSDSKPNDYPESQGEYSSDVDKRLFPISDKGHFPASDKSSLPETEKNIFPEADKALYPEPTSSLPEPSKSIFSESGSALETDRYLGMASSTYTERQSDWPMGSLEPSAIIPSSDLPEIKDTTSPTSYDEDDHLNEAYFLSTPPQSVEPAFPNGQRGAEPPVNAANVPLSKIETVQTHRAADENNWDRPDWNTFEYGKQERVGERRSSENPPAEYHDYQQKRQFNAPWSRPPPRNHWPPPSQFRPPPPLDHGPQSRRFSPYPPRGRGWNRYPRQQY